MLTSVLQFTMLAFKCMAGGPPLDMQREQRWPTQTDHASTVQFTELQQEGEYWSDEVDMMNSSTSDAQL